MTKVDLTAQEDDMEHYSDTNRLEGFFMRYKRHRTIVYDKQVLIGTVAPEALILIFII